MEETCCCSEFHSSRKKKKSVATMTDHMEVPAVLVIPHDDPDMRSNPYELHWRTDGPKWTGNMDSAWSGKYSHLENEVYCRYCGAVPCPLDHDELKDGRLKDLSFVRDIVKDKKELEQKQSKLEENITKLVEDSAGWIGERAMLREDLKLAEKRKQEWDFERRLMEAELNRLKSINDRHQNKLADFRKEQQKIAVLNRRIKQIEDENTELTTELQKVRLLLVSQMDATDKVKKNVQHLTSELQASNDTVRVLKVKLDEANEERDELRLKHQSGETRMKQVEDDIKKLLKELEVKTKHFEEKENMSQFLIKELRNEMLGLKTRLEENERYHTDLEEQIGTYLTEIDKLRNKLGSDKRFRMFVEIKRECNGLKEQNEALLHQKNNLAHAHSIPFMNANGHVTSPMGRQCSPYLQLRRAKSASIFTSRERLYSYRKIRDTLKLENV